MNPFKREGVFDDTLYAQCWEDPAMDREAFRIRNTDVVFSITSGGCNVLAFLADSPRKIISLDLNPFQNYLLDFKMNAFRRLEYNETLELLGVVESSRRRSLYVKIRSGLSSNSRSYWDGQAGKIEHGVIDSGRFEEYMKMIRVLLRMTIGDSAIESMFDARDSAGRESVFDSKWNNLRWQFLTNVILSRSTMSFLFTKAFFAQLDTGFSFGNHFAERARTALIFLNPRESSFLTYILLGGYACDESLPEYLKRENYDRIRANLDRLEIVTGSCADYFARLPRGCITRFNFTNIFEWMPADQFEATLRETIRVAGDNAVMTYRNLLVHREHPRSLDGFIKSDTTLAGRLHESDRSFMYNNYVVEHIHKREQRWDTKPLKQTAGA